MGFKWGLTGEGERKPIDSSQVLLVELGKTNTCHGCAIVGIFPIFRIFRVNTLRMMANLTLV